MMVIIIAYKGPLAVVNQDQIGSRCHPAISLIGRTGMYIPKRNFMEQNTYPTAVEILIDAT